MSHEDKIIRHEQRMRDFEPAVGDSESLDRIVAHFESVLGPVHNVFHELLSDMVHVDVHIIRPTPERNHYTLFTTGMSDRPMTPPEDHEDPDEARYAEVFVQLPPNWLMDVKSFKLEAWYWPVRWLKILARLPHEYETWLESGHTVPNGDPPKPFAPNTKLCCVMVHAPWWLPESFHRLDLGHGKVVRPLAMIPLTRDETDFKLEHSSADVVERMVARGVGPVLDPARTSVLRSR